jgi:hypothetical protein
MGMPEIGRKWGSLAGQIIQHMHNSESLTAGIELSLAQKKKAEIPMGQTCICSHTFRNVEIV